MGETKEGVPVAPVAVVTGAAAGIGKAIAERMARDCYAVALLDVDGENSERTASELADAGFQAKSYACDLTQEAEVKQVFSELLADFGTVDVLINNAGVGGYLDWRTMSQGEWHRFTSVNCDAAFLCTQHAAKVMVEQGKAGRIVFVLSQAALNQDIDIVAPYGTSKWCERGLMKSAAATLAPYGIAVNGVCPGTVWTPMMERFCEEYVAAGNGTEKEYRAYIEAMYPTGRIQEPGDIAAACSFLASNTRGMTGQMILVAGGIVID